MFHKVKERHIQNVVVGRRHHRFTTESEDERFLKRVQNSLTSGRITILSPLVVENALVAACTEQAHSPAADILQLAGTSPLKSDPCFGICIPM